MPSGTYTVTLTATGTSPGTNGQYGTFKWTATYTISTTATPVLAHTYWTSTSTTTNAHDLTPIGFAAAASYMSNSKNTKFSFTLGDSSSATRVTGVSLALQQLQTDGSWLTIATNTLGDLPYDSADASDCLYLSLFDCSNAVGTFTYNNTQYSESLNGNFLYAPTNVYSTAYPSAGQNRSVFEILTTSPDTFGGNNYDLPNGQVHIAKFLPNTFTVPDAGTFRVAFSGTLKGNGVDIVTSQTITGQSNTFTRGAPVCN